MDNGFEEALADGRCNKTRSAFLSELTAEERSCLYNDLLSIKDVYLCNKDTSFYTFRKIRRATKRCAECRKRTFLYQTEHKGELSISQIHEQKRFKIIIVSRSYSMDKRWNTLFSKTCCNISITSILVIIAKPFTLNSSIFCM